MISDLSENQDFKPKKRPEKTLKQLEALKNHNIKRTALCKENKRIKDEANLKVENIINKKLQKHLKNLKLLELDSSSDEEELPPIKKKVKKTKKVKVENSDDDDDDDEDDDDDNNINKLKHKIVIINKMNPIIQHKKPTLIPPKQYLFFFDICF